jgi:hypothetical protein
MARRHLLCLGSWVFVVFPGFVLNGVEGFAFVSALLCGRGEEEEESVWWRNRVVDNFFVAVCLSYLMRLKYLMVLFILRNGYLTLPCELDTGGVS